VGTALGRDAVALVGGWEVSGARHTLSGMGSGTIRAVPDWVPRSRLIVSAAEDYLLWLFGATGSPEVLGSLVALAWVGGIDDTRSPMINQWVEPTKRRVMTEFLIAAPISAGEPYPGQAWFQDEGIPFEVVPSAEFWQAHVGFEATRSYARGISSALGWVLGVIDDLAHLTPVYWEDGAEMCHEDRQACARVLRTIEVRPLPAPARPRLSRPRPEDPRTSWIA
jgi:hypothetical protein